MLSAGFAFSLFFQGILLGSGPCLTVCAPILLPYIAATQKDWKNGLLSTIVFSSARIIIYAVLGAVFGYVGSFILSVSPVVSKISWTLGSLFIIFIGASLVLGKRFNNPLCRVMHDQTGPGSLRNMFILGLIVGIAPCLPLTTALVQIALTSSNLLDGFIYGIIFGLGTVLSPLLILGSLAGFLNDRLGKSRIIRSADILSMTSGVIMMLVGAYIFLSYTLH